jgi:hypothetical protein
LIRYWLPSLQFAELCQAHHRHRRQILAEADFDSTACLVSSEFISALDAPGMDSKTHEELGELLSRFSYGCSVLSAQRVLFIKRYEFGPFLDASEAITFAMLDIAEVSMKIYDARNGGVDSREGLLDEGWVLQRRTVRPAASFCTC